MICGDDMIKESPRPHIAFMAQSGLSSSGTLNDSR